MDTLIEANHVTLQFSASSEQRRSLKEWVLDAVRGKIKRKGFVAVNDVSFTINRGEAVGLIGRNGAGKSTLLKLVTGIAEPTSGNIVIRGQVAPLLALGNGLDPTLTGRENIYLNGAILGYNKAYLKEKESSIIEFSELGDFIDSPVRTYSSGMTMRLAFSIATAASPEILILDEVLAVGDSSFQAKCHARIKEIIDDGATVFFVSHSLADIARLCKRAIWLGEGKILMDGRTVDVIEAYQKVIALSTNTSNGQPKIMHRFYSERVGEGYNTFTQATAQGLCNSDNEWKYLGGYGKAYVVPMPNTVPLLGYYSKKLQAHFFTIDELEAEEKCPKNLGWEFEGIYAYVYPQRKENTIPVYLYRNNTTDKVFYALDKGEVDNLNSASSKWIFEKIAFWVLQ